MELVEKQKIEVIEIINNILYIVDDTLYNGELYDSEDLWRYATYHSVLRRQIEDIKNSSLPPLVLLEHQRIKYSNSNSSTLKYYAEEAISWIINDIV